MIEIRQDPDPDSRVAEARKPMGYTGTLNPRFSGAVVVVQLGEEGVEVAERSASVCGTEGAADDTAPPGPLCGDDFFGA